MQESPKHDDTGTAKRLELSISPASSLGPFRIGKPFSFYMLTLVVEPRRRILKRLNGLRDFYMGDYQLSS